MIGKRISHYKVLEKIGEGGMGEVYLAEDTSLERKVALKFLPEYLRRDQIAPQRFLREAKAAAALDHPFICHIHEIGEAEVGPFIAMEYVEGETLKSRLRSEPLTYREVVRIGSEISEAVQKAHEQGIIHRDLKPSNIMLTREGRVKVMDFGLAKRVVTEDGAEEDITAALTEEGTTLGTLIYMSPEQVRAEKVDVRSDIFSLGVVLYEMLLGKHPFRRKGPMETASAILKEVPEFPVASQAGPGVILHTIIRKMLVKDPAQRCQSIQEVHTTLERLWHEVTPISWTHKWHYWVTVLGVVASLTVAFYFLSASAAMPVLTNKKELTSDGRTKSWHHLVTDGDYVYYSETVNPMSPRDAGNVWQVSAQGGPSFPINTHWPDRSRVTLVQDISPTAPELLVTSQEGNKGGPNLWVLPVPAGTPVRLSDICAEFARWSPDGQQLAYSIENELYVARGDGSDPKPLVSLQPEAALFLSSWSPDGQKLCYCVWRDRASERMELWQVGVDGSDARQLFGDWQRSTFLINGQWTPDGEFFLFRARHRGRYSLWIARNETGLLRQGRSEPELLDEDVLDYKSFTFSPDGRRIYALRTRMKAEVQRYHHDSLTWIPYDFAPEPSPMYLDFSRDGDWVAYVKYPEGTLWISRVDGSQQYGLTESEPLYVSSPRWSPDGERIAFSAGANPNPTRAGYRVYVVEISGGPLKRAIGEEYTQLDACWSSNGRLLISGGRSGSHPLRLVHLETGEIEDLPESRGLWECAWSRDGKFIASRSADGQVVLLEREAGKWIRLGDCRGEQLLFSRDSKQLYFGEATMLFQFDIEEQKVAKVADLDIRGLSADYWWYSFSPDGELLCPRDLGGTELYSLDFEVP